MNERAMADAFDKWLRQEGLVFRRDRMDKATTCVPGWPDFEIIACHRVLLIELKTEKGALSKDQKAMHERFRLTGSHVHVCRSLEHATMLVREWREQLPKPYEHPTGEPTAGTVSKLERLLAGCVVVPDGRGGWTRSRKASEQDLMSLQSI